MISVAAYISILFYFIFLFIWITALLAGSKKYNDYIKPLDTKQHPLKDFYGVGFCLLDWIRYSYNSPLDRKRLTQSRIVFGVKYGDYYFRINLAQKLTYAFTLFVISFLFIPITGENVSILFGFIAAGVAFWYIDSKITDIIEDREESISRNFPDVLSKITLLINAGMVMREAWDTVSQTGQGILFEEMEATTAEIRNGTPEIEAYINFGNRCGVTSIKKFTSLLVQNLTKGNRELVEFLRDSTSLHWTEKKHFVKQKAEKATNKLLLPIGLIFIGILVMILVPILGNLGM